MELNFPNALTLLLLALKFTGHIDLTLFQAIIPTLIYLVIVAIVALYED